MNNSIRCLVCFKCEEYMIIYSNEQRNLELENKFKALHNRHMIQVVTYDEIPKGFTLFIYQTYKQDLNGLIDMNGLVKEFIL